MFEVPCTAAITEAKPSKDPQPESYKIENDSIEILSEPLSTENAWRARKQIVEPLISHCLCCLKQARDADGFPTLGLFRPKAIERLTIEPEANPNWTSEELELLIMTSVDAPPMMSTRRKFFIPRV